MITRKEMIELEQIYSLPTEYIKFEKEIEETITQYPQVGFVNIRVENRFLDLFDSRFQNKGFLIRFNKKSKDEIYELCYMAYDDEKNGKFQQEILKRRHISALTTTRVDIVWNTEKYDKSKESNNDDGINQKVE
jgi:hypothetical protein